MAAKRAFLDTNGWIALLNSSDSLHSMADSVWARLLGQGYSILLTDWIIAETGNGLARTSARVHFVDAVELLRVSPRAHLLSVSPQLIENALDLYTSRSDKTWGLVDCASMLVMQEHGVDEVFTNDRHFEQAGFQRLLPIP
jgi:predicted nucleic acid-binding protein